MPGDRGGTGFLLLLHYSLWNVVFISWFETALHRRQICGATHKQHPLEHFTHPFSTNTFEKTASDRCPKQMQSWEARKKKKPDKMCFCLSLCAQMCCLWACKPPIEVNVLLHFKRRRRRTSTIGRCINSGTRWDEKIGINPFSGAAVS